MHERLTQAVCLALVMTLGPRVMRAQCDSCRIIQAFTDSSFTIEVNGRRYRAFTEAQQRRFLALAARADRAERVAALKDSLLTGSEGLLAQYDSTLAQQRSYTATIDSLYHGYKDLALGYRRLAGEPILTVQLGAGAAGPETEPALLAGVGLWRFRVWGLFQKSNAGVLAGVSWRIF